MSSQYHEPPEELAAKTRDLTRVLVSLKEEVEAIDWYNQRIELSTDPQVAKILKHNQEEEMEHACMALEYLRRNMDGWDEALRTYLFTEGDITELEEIAMGRNGASGAARSAGTGSLGIGNLKGVE
ncbi:MAG: encapsulin-associated ferritin-like protein [Spirochaetaceae bacterium]